MIRAEGVHVWRASPGRPPVQALQGLNLVLGAGELGVVLGRSGAGKTTLLEALGGLLPLSAGKVGIGGRCWGPGALPPPDARPRAGVLFQQPERQLFGANALEDVSWGLGPEGAAEARRALDRLELPRHLWTAPLGRLSRGEKRRVALAGVLARRPAALLLDEPAVGLDPAGQELLLREIEACRAGDQAAVLVATHWPEPLLGRADAVLCLGAGRLLHAGPAAGLEAAALRDARVAELLPFSWRLRLSLEAGRPPWEGRGRLRAEEAGGPPSDFARALEGGREGS